MTSIEKEIERLIAEQSDDSQIAAAIKKDNKTYAKTLPESFRENGGKAFLLKYTRRIDTIVSLAYRVATRSMFGEYLPLKNQIPLTVAALGSYGREQLCVHSDIDILFVYEELPGYQIKTLIEKVLYILWDAGLKLGHRVHALDELSDAAQSDITIKSAILESRFIDGSKHLWAKSENQINHIRKNEPEKFIAAKIEEQRELHQRFPLTMEPNIKEGMGGFRDANLVFWIGKLLYNAPRIKDLPSEIVNDEDYKRYRIALEFLFRVRSALHLITGKKEDRLRMEYIPQVSAMLGYDQTPQAQMKFARKTIESLRIIHLYSKIWLEMLVSPRLPDAYKEYLLIEPKPKLHQLIKELNTNAIKPFTPHPKTLYCLLQSKKPDKPNDKFYRIVSNIFRQPHSYSVLKTLHTAGLLKDIIPPLRKVVDLPQFDGYHTYSVDIHSIKSVWHLENISDKYLIEKYNTLSNDQKHLLKLVTLLHDSGKGRKKPHALIGASLFRVFGQKLGIGKDQIETGAHLIQYHDVMSRTAQREDLYNEKTILRFASLFKNKTMLDMIYLLTYADMNGVGKRVYTEHTASLLKILYNESLKVLDHIHLLDNTARRLQKIETIKRSRSFGELGQKERRFILSVPSNELFIHYSTKNIIDICTWAMDTDGYKYRITPSPYLTIEISRKISLDLGYLLSKLARLNIRALDIYKLSDTIKYFRIVFSETVDKGEIFLIEKIINGAFGEHSQSIYTKPKIDKKDILIDCDHSRDYAAMRLRTKDQKGLLAYIAQIFEELHIDIASTKIHTFKHYVNDLFLIEKDGNFCHNTEKIIQKLTE